MGGFGISVLGIIVKMALWSVPMMRSECKIIFLLVSQLVELVYMLSIRVAVFYGVFVYNNSGWLVDKFMIMK